MDEHRKISINELTNRIVEELRIFKLGEGSEGEPDSITFWTYSEMMYITSRALDRALKKITIDLV